MRWANIARSVLIGALALSTAACTRSVRPSSATVAPPAAPLARALALFSAPDIPARGPAEAEPIAPNWPESTAAPTLPGNGLAQHPMLYAGEGHNVLFVVNGGKVVWTYSTGKGGEIDDVWMLANGHILYARMFFVEEVTPQKQVVWHYDAPKGTERQHAHYRRTREARPRGGRARANGVGVPAGRPAGGHRVS